MAQYISNFLKLANSDLANQLALPVKSLTGYFLTKYGASQSSPLNKLLIDSLEISPGSKILEIGYGRGHGIQYCLDKLKGDGLICGIERSQYMEDVARKKFILELTESNNLSLDKCIDLRNLPYPTDFFNKIYHIDVFYFLHQDRLPEICKEFHRVLLPGCKILCGMEFKRLTKLSKYGLLDESQWNPMRYMACLEPVGFVDVKIDYVDHASGRQYQLISARKPEADEKYFDPNAQMAHLEKQIKREMLMVELKKSGRTPSKEDLEIMREDVER